jgi:DNA-binding CsgD family transcriptional regulator
VRFGRRYLSGALADPSRARFFRGSEVMDLLERRPQLDELNRALDRACGGGGGCIALVAGEAGIGKTALVNSFTRGLAEAYPTVALLWGACDALFTPRPLGPLLDMMPQCSGALRTALEAGAARERIFAAFLDELRRHDPACVIVLEDVHWADEATLDLLTFVGRRIRQTPGVVVATYREDEVGASHPFRRVLGGLPGDAVRRIRVPLLSESAVSRLARLAGRSAEGLHALTGGNPFFVTEVLAGGAAQVPASVHDAVLARAARLPREAREVLDPISVLPGRAERWLVEALAGPSSARYVDTSISSGMLVGTPTTVAFRHELARRTWEATIEPGRAATLHAQVLDLLLERGAAQTGLARLVHHADRAGRGDCVLQYAPAAAREAAIVGAHREAAAHFDTALRYADPLPAEERATLLEACSYERHLVADLDDAVRAREAALAIRRALNDHLREGSDVRWLSRLAWFQGQRDRAIELGREAVGVLEPLGSTVELAMAYSNLSQLAMLDDGLADAAAWGDRAIAMAERLGDVETLAHALNNVGTARMYNGQDNAGRQQVERALSLALENGYHEHAVRTYTNLACIAINSRDFEVAEERVARTLAFAAEHDLETFSLYMTGWRARLRLDRGDWEGAERDALAVLDRYRVMDVVRFPALVVLALLRARTGAAGAEALLDEAGRLAAPSRELQRLVPATTARAEAAWIRGDLAGAEAETHAAYEQAMRTSISWYRGPLAYWLWRIGRLDAMPESIPKPYELQMVGDWAAAAAIWERIGCPYERALALAQTNERESLREAIEVLEGLGARASAQAVRRDLRGRGIRGIPRGPRSATRANPGGLTRSQAKVLALLALGTSNADIARQLFLSPRTVDHHVSAILRRLGVHTRAEAIAAAHTRHLIPED